MKDPPPPWFLKSAPETIRCQLSGILKLIIADGQPIKYRKAKIQKLQKAHLDPLT